VIHFSVECYRVIDIMKKTFSFLVASLILVSLAVPTFVVGQSDLTFVFLDAPAQVEVVVGSSTTQEIRVKNIGDFDNVVQLDVETNGPLSVSVVPGSLQVARGSTGTLSLSFLSSPTNVVNRYPSKLKLKGNGVDLAHQFDIVILPTQEKKFDINNGYLSSLNKFENLEKRFEQVKEGGCLLVQSSDLSAATPRQISESLQNIGDTLEKTRIAIKEDDFVTANVEEEKSKYLVSKVEAEINSLRGAQEECEKEQSRLSSYVTGGVVATSIGIIVIVAIVAFVAYRHYTRLPKVRKLLPSGDVNVKVKNTEHKPELHPGIKRVGRDFKYEFKKKK